MYWTVDRFLLIAVVITLISVDGVYRAWLQRSDERIDHRLFLFYAALLFAGSSMAWAGFFIEWAKT